MILSPIDQRIRDAGFNYVPFNQFLASPFQIPQGKTATDPNTGAGIVTLPMGGGGSGGGALQAGDPMMNFDNFYDYTSNKYFSNMPTPLIDALPESMRAKTFMGFPSYREQQLTGPDIGEYIASGTDIPLELTTAGKIQQELGSAKEGLAGLAEKFRGIGPISMILGSMDRFDTLPKLDQEFIKANMGYRGPTVFGENTGGGNVDPFGVNVRSAFGNYAEKVRNEFDSLGESLGGRLSEKYGARFDPETGMFVGEDEEAVARANKMTKMMRAKYNFRQKQIEQQKINEKIAENNRKVAEAQARSQAAADNQRMQRQSDGGGGGNLTRSREQGGLGLSASQAQAVSAANAAAGMGGYGLADGGIVDMLEIYD
tara:strand:+ start:37 stop:1149 length:1113 start_codon:yes stop_codon:yes gene_type:complete